MTLFHLPTLSEWFDKKSALQATFWSLLHALVSAFLLNYFAGTVGESPIWIPAGISLGVLLTLGLRYWPFLLIGATLGEMGGGHHLWMAMQLAGGAVGGCLIAKCLLTRYWSFDPALESLRDYGRLLFASAIGATFSAAINITFLVLAGLLPFENLMPIYQKWFIGDFFGLAFVTPIVLVLTQTWVKTWSKKKMILFVLGLGAAFLLGQAVFFGWFREFVDLTGRGFFFMFVMALFAYFFGRHGALALFAMVMIQSILSAVHGDGYFSRDLMSKPSSQVIWIFLGILCAVGLLISLIVKSFKKQSLALKEASWVAIESAIHFKGIVSAVPMLMATYDITKQKTDYVNPFFTKVLGYTSEDFVEPDSWWQQAYPDPEYQAEVLEKWNARIEASNLSRQPFELLETTTTGKDGKEHQIIWGCFHADKRLVIYGEDVTQQRKAGKILEMTSAVYRAMGEAVVITDAKNMVVLANEAFQNLTGYRDDELIGYVFSDFLIKRHGARSYSDIFTSLEAMGRWEGQAWIKTRNNEDLLRFISIYSTFDKNGFALQRVILVSDVTDQRKARELINQQANFDPLTGLPNRRLMLDRLEQLIKQASRSQKSLAVIYIDLDNFKDINDSRGHDFGDELLRSVATRLRSEVRETDTVARIGGDEFVVLLGELDRPENADIIIRQILKKLAEPFLIQDQAVYATASFGISMFPNDGTDGKALLLGADQAMYAAKSNGRNGYQYFTQSLQIQASYRAGVIAELRTALEKKQFVLQYQPIVNLETGIITHAEALLRWRRESGEIVMPGAFIGIAEESGLIVEIGDWVFQEVIHFLKSLGEDNQVSIALNVSASQFNSNQHSAAKWVGWMGEANISPEMIVLEITERMMLIQSQRVLRKIAMLQEAGCKFSVDDFGTGYSSLASLKDFNFDYIKIDAHFIKTLLPGSMDASLVSAMVSMAEGLGLHPIAEGVETQAQADMLRDMGCTYAQGYLFNKPLTSQEFKNLLV